MKRKTSPQRRQTGASIALFPFLAVLVCTMGALIVMLMVTTRQAKCQAVAAAAQKAVQEEANLQQQQEDVRWRIEQLKASRQATEAQQAELRLQLGHLEDHTRRLQQRLADLEAAWAALERSGGGTAQDRAALQTELTRLRATIADAQRRLDEACQAANRRSRSFAVVPYQGPNETRRRPMYIECRDDAVVLQPEGVALKAEDFDGPGGPGNPLAASLRAMREHWVARQGFAPEKSGEPYPLLLVRPGGVAAYYVARDALKSWGSDFGYELVGEDWQLAFPPADPELAALLRETIDNARARQYALMAAAPRAYQGSRERFRAAPGGGIMREDDGAPGGSGDGPSGGSDRGGSFGPRGGFGSGGGSVSGSGGGFAPGGTEGADSRDRDTGASGSSAARPKNWALAGSPRERTGLPPQDASTTPAGQTPAYAPGQASGGSAGQASGAACPSPSPDDPQPGQSAHKLAKVRGKDWGLKNASRGSVPITRPIRVECHADRLVLVPERGTAGGKTIPLGPRTIDAIDSFVSAVWEYMDTWGIAGRGMHWRPVLGVTVAPGAEGRFQDLQTLLDGSGLEVRRKE